MSKFIFSAFLLVIISTYVSATESMISIESHYSVKETANRFEAIAKKKGLTIFTRINHQKNAAGVNLKLRATEVILFGNPKVGTPLMLCAQTAAIDLPQKVLIRADENHKVWLSYNNPQYIKERHNIQNCDKVITKISKVLSVLGHAATNK